MSRWPLFWSFLCGANSVGVTIALVRGDYAPALLSATLMAYTAIKALDAGGSR